MARHFLGQRLLTAWGQSRMGEAAERSALRKLKTRMEYSRRFWIISRSAPPPELKHSLVPAKPR